MPRNYKQREEKKQKRMNILKYLMVLSLGMLAIVATLLIVPKKAEEILPEDISGETETQTQTQTEPETISVLESANSSGAYAILDSTYKRVNNYSWEDMYTLLALLAKTTPVTEQETPIFTMLHVRKSAAPLLIIGKQDNEGNDNIEIYVLSEEKIYLLLKAKGSFEADVKHGLLYDRIAGKIYDYEPHNFLAYDAASLDLTAFDFKPVNYTRLPEINEPITVEQIKKYILKEEQEVRDEQ